MLRLQTLYRPVSWIVLALAFGQSLAVTARAQDNQIQRVTVASETRDSVAFDVQYRYGGDRGANVFMSVIMAQDGKTSGNYAYQPARINRGRHIARVTLSAKEGAPAAFSTNQVQVAMYVGGEEKFTTRSFFFPKTWTRPGAALSPVLETIVVAKPFAQPIVPLTPGAAGTSRPAPVRRVLANGHVEIRYPDGTIRERYVGGETITRPDGSRQMLAFASAQPPTPPSAPPDESHAAWLLAEGERLLGIIRTLVGNDDASVGHYLSEEGAGISPYQRISSRTQAVNFLVRP